MLKLFILAFLLVSPVYGQSRAIRILSHEIVAYAPGEFNAWPANKGAQQWIWGNEILVGHRSGIFEEKEGHNNQEGSTQLRYARTLDGGKTWTSQAPVFIANPFPAQGIDFTNPDFALYVEEDHFGFYYSYDRGRQWNGPYSLNSLLLDPRIRGHEFSARTDYLVISQNELLIFASSRNRRARGLDYSYVAKTTDGGKTFSFVSYMDPEDRDRQVMASTVLWQEETLVSCLRRKHEGIFGGETNWIECYRSTNLGRTWTSLGKASDTGEDNGNPPALVKVDDGRLVLVYAARRRTSGEPSISAKVSMDGGRTWSAEIRLRDQDYRGPDRFGDVDIGYSRAYVRPDGKIVAVYYWATAARREEHLAATIFELEN